MKRSVLAFLLLLAVAVAAHAETFTWTAPLHYVLDGEDCGGALDMNRVIEPAYCGPMQLQVRIQGSGLTWQTVHEFPTWVPGASMSWTLEEPLEPGWVYEFRVTQVVYTGWLGQPTTTPRAECPSDILTYPKTDGCPPEKRQAPSVTPSTP